MASIGQWLKVEQLILEWEVGSTPRPSHVEVRKRLRRLVQRHPKAIYTVPDFWTLAGLYIRDVDDCLQTLGARRVRSGGRRKGYRRADLERALGLGVQVEISPKHDGTAKGT